MIDFIKEGLKWLPVDLVRNEIQHIIPAMDPELYPDRSGIKYYLDLDIPDFPMSSTFETMIRLEGREKPPVLSAGAYVYEGCSFRLEELLAGQLTIAVPAKNDTRLSAVASMTTKYRIREIVQPELVDRYLPTRTAIRAGLALRDFVGYGHDFFARYQVPNKQFLTWQPNNKLVGRAQREYLYFLLNMEVVPETVKLRGRITKSDGSRQIVTFSEIESLRQYQIICCQVGTSVLTLDPDVIKYEIWLSDQDDQRFSEVRTYNIDTRSFPYERHLIFSNSLGGFDTIRLLGIGTQETDVVKATSKKERIAGKGLDFSELEVIQVSESSGLKVSTGLFEQDAVTYQDYMRELLLSEVIFLDTDYGFEAMNLITSNLEYSRDRSGLIEKSFQLVRTYSDKNYSRMPAVEPVPSRPTKWVGVAAKAVLDAFGKRTGKLAYQRLQKVFEDNGSKVVPFAVKPNIPGDPDYINPILEESIIPGTTPFPSVVIEREIDFKKNNCASGYIGTAPTVSIPAGTYGGEASGDADELAEARFSSFNNQAYANSNGTCALNTTPVHFAIFHKISMTGLQVTGSSDFGPVLDLRLAGAVAIPNTTGNNPPANRLSEATFVPGIYNLIMSLSYGGTPSRACKIKIPARGLEQTANSSGFVIFENVQVNSADEPFTIEVTNV